MNLKGSDEETSKLSPSLEEWSKVLVPSVEAESEKAPRRKLL